MRLAGLVVLLAGCHYVFGVDPPESDAPIDAAPLRVEGTLERVHVYNNVDGTPIASTGTLDPAVDCPAVFAGDAPLEVACDPAAGTFTFELPREQPYRLLTANEESSPGVILPTERVSTGLAPDITLIRWGRPDEVTALAGTRLQISIADANNLGLTGNFHFGSNGVWTRSVQTATTGVATFDWTAGLLDATKGDRVFAYREYQPDATGRPYLAQVYDRGEASVSMVQQMVAATSVRLQLLARSRCVHVGIDVPRIMARLGNLFPAIPPWRRGYILYAAPSPTHGVVNVASLSRDLVDTTGLPAQQTTPFDQRELYPAALPGHEAVLINIVDRYDKTSLAYAGAQVVHRLASEMCTTPSCCEEPPAYPEPAMATDLKLAGVNLDTAYTTVGVPLGEPVEVRWTMTNGAPPQRIAVQIVERVMPLDPPTLALRYRWFLPPDRTSLEFDPALLEPGKIYLLQINAETGYPESSEGRFGPPMYPVGSATSRSQPFYVDH